MRTHQKISYEFSDEAIKREVRRGEERKRVSKAKLEECDQYGHDNDMYHQRVNTQYMVTTNTEIAFDDLQ